MPSTTDTIALDVLLFSALRDHVGSGHLSVTLPTPANGTLLLDYLADKYPVIATYRPVIRLAVNAAYAAPTVSLHEGDEVALITPVSGG